MAVTEEPEDGGYIFEGQPMGDDDAETQLYKKAVQTVAESQKASTSYIQRQLRIGYNNAARLIERMEREGKVKIGGASCRERVCEYVSISVVAVSLKKQKTNKKSRY